MPAWNAGTNPFLIVAHARLEADAGQRVHLATVPQELIEHVEHDHDDRGDHRHERECSHRVHRDAHRCLPRMGREPLVVLFRAVSERDGSGDEDGCFGEGDAVTARGAVFIGAASRNEGERDEECDGSRIEQFDRFHVGWTFLVDVELNCLPVGCSSKRRVMEPPA